MVKQATARTPLSLISRSAAAGGPRRRASADSSCGRDGCSHDCGYRCRSQRRAREHDSDYDLQLEDAPFPQSLMIHRPASNGGIPMKSGASRRSTGFWCSGRVIGRPAQRGWPGRRCTARPSRAGGRTSVSPGCSSRGRSSRRYDSVSRRREAAPRRCRRPRGAAERHCALVAANRWFEGTGSGRERCSAQRRSSSTLATTRWRRSRRRATASVSTSRWPAAASWRRGRTVPAARRWCG